MELPEFGLREALIGVACLFFTRKLLHIILARNRARHNNNIVQVQRPTPPAILASPIPSPIPSLLTPAPTLLVNPHGEDEDYETASDDDGSDNGDKGDPYRDFKRKLRYQSILENKTE